jgi:hypothetical protein
VYSGSFGPIVTPSTNNQGSGLKDDVLKEIVRLSNELEIANSYTEMGTNSLTDVTKDIAGGVEGDKANTTMGTNLPTDGTGNVAEGMLGGNANTKRDVVEELLGGKGDTKGGSENKKGVTYANSEEGSPNEDQRFWTYVLRFLKTRRDELRDYMWTKDDIPEYHAKIVQVMRTESRCHITSTTLNASPSDRKPVREGGKATAKSCKNTVRKTGEKDGSPLLNPVELFPQLKSPGVCVESAIADIWGVEKSQDGASEEDTLPDFE